MDVADPDALTHRPAFVAHAANPSERQAGISRGEATGGTVIDRFHAIDVTEHGALAACQ